MIVSVENAWLGLIQGFVMSVGKCKLHSDEMESKTRCGRVGIGKTGCGRDAGVLVDERLGTRKPSIDDPGMDSLSVDCDVASSSKRYLPSGKVPLKRLLPRKPVLFSGVTSLGGSKGPSVERL